MVLEIFKYKIQCFWIKVSPKSMALFWFWAYFWAALVQFFTNRCHTFTSHVLSHWLCHIITCHVYQTKKQIMFCICKKDFLAGSKILGLLVNTTMLMTSVLVKTGIIWIVTTVNTIISETKTFKKIISLIPQMLLKLLTLKELMNET